MTKHQIERKVKNYIRVVRQAIETEFGNLPEYYSVQIDQLEQSYRIYLRACEELNSQQLVVLINDGKTQTANLNFQIMKSCIADMDKIIKSFGLNPLAMKRIRGKAETPEEDDFMNGI